MAKRIILLVLYHKVRARVPSVRNILRRYRCCNKNGLCAAVVSFDSPPLLNELTKRGCLCNKITIKCGFYSGFTAC